MPENARYTLEMLRKVAPKLGITLEFEPDYGYVGEMILPNGKRKTFFGRNLNINGSASIEIARDKGHTCYFLRKKGFRVPDGRVFFSPAHNKVLPVGVRADLSDAVDYAKKMGFPLFVKPNDLSQGTLVTKVHNEEQLRDVAKKIFKLTKVMIIERPCSGNDYRVVTLGDKVISVYQRIHASVIGDGVSTIDQLLAQKCEEFRRLGREEKEVPRNDFRVVQHLAAKGLTFKSVIKKGYRLQLLDNANTSTGGTPVDLTDKVHPSFCKIAVAAAQTLNLDICGVDFIASDITKSAKGQKWWIIELNGNPQLNNNADIPVIQNKRMEVIYKSMLKYIIHKNQR